MSSVHLPRVVNQKGLKLKPVDIDFSMRGGAIMDNTMNKKHSKLPPSYQKQHQQHSHNYKLQQALVIEDESKQEKKRNRQHVSFNEMNKLTDIVDEKPPKQLSLSLRSNMNNSRDENSGLNRSNVSLEPIGSMNVLLEEKPRSSKSRRSNTISESVTQNAMFHYSSPSQPVKIFGDESSSVHSLRAKLSIETLTAGCINAFCEFFTLSHRAPVMIDPIAETYYTIPQDKLVIIKNFLVKAEEHQRDSNFKEVYHIYRQIADYFEAEKDIDTALYYHQLGQKVAKRSSDTLLEGIAHENVGKVYERLGQTENALKSHEAHLSLADASRDSGEMEKARKQLWSVYVKMAKDNEVEEKFHDACVFYEKSLKTAKASNDTELVAKSYFYLGKIYEKLDDFSTSLSYQEHYTSLCDQLSDVKGKASAHRALGQLYERLGKTASALHMYKRFLDSAEHCDDDRLVAHACERVGLVLNQMGDYDESVPYFERNFSLAQRSGDEEWLGTAKVKLGFAKGNATMMLHLEDLLKKDDMHDSVVQTLK
jgi:tetratricopeptide (TPR) repeat protein